MKTPLPSQPGMVAHIGNLSTQEGETEVCEFQAILGCTPSARLRNETPDKMSKPPQGCMPPNAQLGRLSSDSSVNR